MRAIENPVSDGDYHNVCVRVKSCVCVSSVPVGVCVCVCVSRSGWCPWPCKAGLFGVIYLIPAFPAGLAASSSSPGLSKSTQLVVFCIHMVSHTVFLYYLN